MEYSCNINNDNCSFDRSNLCTDTSNPIPFNTNIIDFNENNYSEKINMSFIPDDCNNYEKNEQYSKSDFLLKDGLSFFNIKGENNRFDIFGFSLRLDTIVIIGIIIFLLFEKSADFILIICLGLMLLDFNLDFLNFLG